jgi:hypothetical protein
MRELTDFEVETVSGGQLISFDGTGLNIHLVFGSVEHPGLLNLLGIPHTSDMGELRIHLGPPVTPAPGLVG